VDSDGFPVYSNDTAQPIPPPGTPYLINPPPGCFGLGPGGLKYTKGLLTLNTSSFITYAQVKTKN
jgi:hypothetical protein